MIIVYSRGLQLKLTSGCQSVSDCQSVTAQLIATHRNTWNDTTPVHAVTV